ncbi:MAG: hypothetical protein ACJ788_17010 [Ktedonobacteraceae bacterium]|jgi:hypothetical protein
MVWQLTAPQCFFLAIIAFGVIGFQRGWRREIISLAFILTGILFLVFGSLGVAQFVFVNLPRAAQALLTGTSTTQPAATISTSDPRLAISTGLVFVGFIALGYMVSRRVAPGPASAAERIWGLVPAVISGYAILTFITNAFGKTALFTVNVNTPNQNLIGSYLLVIFIVVVIAIIVALIAASSKKKEPPKPAGK